MTKPALRCLHTARIPVDSLNALTQVFGIEGSHDGPLAGLRYAVKDNIATRTGYTTCASNILRAGDEAYVSPFDATCVELLNKAGARMVAKTNMDEFGMGSFNTNSALGHVLNPHDQSKVTGGSSGGSAASLFNQDSSIDFALGSDTGGSIRIPASHCGVYGFKPSYGAISRYGLVPYANSLDTIGIFVAQKSGSIARLRALVDCLYSYDPRDPTSLNQETRRKMKKDSNDRPITVGIPEQYHTAELSSAVLRMWRSAAKHLSQQTKREVVIKAVSLPLTELALPAYYVLALAEASSNLQRYSGLFYGIRNNADRVDGQLFAGTRALFGDEVKRRILLGCLSLSSDRYENYFLKAQRIRAMIVAEFSSIFAKRHPLIRSGTGEVDFLLTPTCPSTAVAFKEVDEIGPIGSMAADVMTVPASLAGLPAISVPFDNDSEGLPFGVQLIGQFGDDHQLLDMAELFE